MSVTWRAALIDPGSVDWPEKLDRLRAELGAPDNPRLFPAHFLKATFPKIGGRALRVETVDGRLLAGGSLFPRGIDGHRRVYTLRYHPAVAGRGAVDPAALCRQVEVELDNAHVVFDDPIAPQTYQRTGTMVDGVDLGAPDDVESRVIRSLAQQIWQSEPDALYPVDIPAEAFGAGTALVARLNDGVAGFLLGFVKFGGPPLPAPWAAFDRGLRLESQLLGVSPVARQRGLATLLKCLQGRQTAARGIGVINWTVDPLQFGNAVLNFGRLRAVAADFLPDYYPFRNALNQVAASRLAMTWLVDSDRVRPALASSAPTVIHSLRELPEARRVNDGPGSPVLDAEAPQIAIEIPAHWTALQRADLALAQTWRETTDRVFARYLGREPGQYLLTDVATDGERCFLIGRRIDPALLAEYGAMESGECGNAD